MPYLYNTYLKDCEKLLNSAKVQNDRIQSLQFSSYVAELRRFNEKFYSFYQVVPGAGGKYPYPPLTEKDLKELEIRYDLLRTAGEDYLRYHNEGCSKEEQELFRACKDKVETIQTAIGTDVVEVFNNFRDVEGKTLPELIDAFISRVAGGGQIEEQNQIEEPNQIKEQKPIEEQNQIKEQKPIEKPEPIDIPNHIEDPNEIEEPKHIKDWNHIETPKPIEDPNEIEEPNPIEPPKPFGKTNQFVTPMPIKDPNEIEEPNPIEKTEQIEDPKPIEEPNIFNRYLKDCKELLEGKKDKEKKEDKVNEEKKENKEKKDIYSNKDPYGYFVSYVACLREFNEKIDPFYQVDPKAGGKYPPVTENDALDLKMKYTFLGMAAGKYREFYDTCSEEDKKLFADRLKLVETIDKKAGEYTAHAEAAAKAGKTMPGLNDAVPGNAVKGEQTDPVLDVLFNEIGNGTWTVDISGKERKTVINGYLQRTKLTITGEDGAPMKGFFTQRSTLDLKQEADKVIREVSEKYPDIEDKVKEAVNLLIKEPRRAGELDQLMRTINDEDRRDAIGDALDHLESIQTVKKDTKDTTDAPVDTRNVAMSRLAELWGCGDIVAKAVPMKLVDNGREIEGTFVQQPKGSDFNDLKLNDPLLKVKESGFDKSPVLRQLADLGVMDYICGNVRREFDSFRYQMDMSDPEKPKIIGIVGINNEFSFGKAAKSKCTSGLDGITCISESMAEHVRKTTPDMLRTLLDSTGLKKENLDDAVDRLNKLQEKLTAKKIKVIDDKDFTKYKLENLTGENNTINIFNCAEDAITQIGNREVWDNDMSKESGAPQEEDGLDLTTKVDRHSLGQDVDPLMDIYKDLTRAEKWVFGGSVEYQNVKKHTEKLLKLMSKYTDPNYVATERDEKDMLREYNTAEALCVAYLWRKAKDGGFYEAPDTKTGKRVAAVRKFHAFCKSRSKLLRREEIEQAEKQAAEQARDEKFSKMKPEELGTRIKELNVMAQNALNNNDPETIAVAGRNLSDIMAYAKKNKLKAEQLGLKEGDIKAISKNIGNGRNPQAVIDARNEEIKKQMELPREETSQTTKTTQTTQTAKTTKTTQTAQTTKTAKTVQKVKTDEMTTPGAPLF